MTDQKKVMIRQYAVFIVAVCTLLMACDETNAPLPPSGRPIGIAEEADFAQLRANLSGRYFLANDIMLSLSFEPIGDVESFTGSLDGAGFTISGLSITDTTTGEAVGLFRSIGSSGSVSDLIVETPSVTGTDRVGVLAGINEGTITRVEASDGTVTGNNYVAGLVGENRGSGTIVMSASTAMVTGSGSTTIPGFAVTGGLAALNGGSISESYAGGSVSNTGSTADSKNGGLVGWNPGGSIEMSYAAGGTVSSTNGVAGGFIGGFDSGSISDCHFDTGTSGQLSALGQGTLPTGSVEDHNAATSLLQVDFPNWDFTNTWAWVGNGVWPLLAWRQP